MNIAEREILKRFKRLLKKRLQVSQIVLFGSRARGDAASDSDMDILVILDNPTQEAEEYISECAWEAGFDHGIVVESNPLLTRFDATRGSPTYMGAITLRNNPQLLHLGFAQTHYNIGPLIIEGIASTSLSFVATSMSESVDISNNPLLGSLEFRNLDNARETLTLSGNLSLRTVSFLKLLIADGLVFQSNGQLEEISLPMLLNAGERGGSGLIIEDNTLFDTLTAPYLAAVGDLSIQRNPQYPQCAACALLGQLREYGSFTFSENKADTCADDCS